MHEQFLQDILAMHGGSSGTDGQFRGNLGGGETLGQVEQNLDFPRGQTTALRLFGKPAESFLVSQARLGDSHPRFGGLRAGLEALPNGLATLPAQSGVCSEGALEVGPCVGGADQQDANGEDQLLSGNRLTKEPGVRRDVRG